MDRSQRRGRAVRGAAAAAVATTVAATAHTLSGGDAPPVWLLVAVTLLATPIAVLLTGRRPSLWRTTSVVAVSQLLLHLAFATVGTAGPAGGRHVHGAAVSLAGSGGDGAGAVGALASDPLMLAGHVAAAAVTVLLVSHGERALRAIAAGLRHVVERTVIAWHRPAPLLRVIALPLGTARGAVALTSVSRRGPPVLSL